MSGWVLELPGLVAARLRYRDVATAGDALDAAALIRSVRIRVRGRGRVWNGSWRPVCPYVPVASAEWSVSVPDSPSERAKARAMGLTRRAAAAINDATAAVTYAMVALVPSNASAVSQTAMAGPTRRRSVGFADRES
jgi:hypothetical protein